MSKFGLLGGYLIIYVAFVTGLVRNDMAIGIQRMILGWCLVISTKLDLYHE